MKLSELVKEPNVQFIDVRTTAEFESIHVKGAVNIPLSEFAQRYTEIENLGDTPVVFYCHSGNRSGQAVAYLNQLGIKNIYNGGGVFEVMNYIN